MNALQIALEKLHAVILNPELIQPDKAANPSHVLTLNANMMSLGYILSESLFNTLSQCKPQTVIQLSADIMPVLKRLQGAHVKHKPMYPNFPQQVMEASDIELFINAITHYYSQGVWQPQYTEATREFAFENIKFQSIDAVDESQFRQLFTSLLSSHDSLSAQDKSIVEWFLAQDYVDDLVIPTEIKFQENKCLIAAHFLQQQRSLKPVVKTATDILRIVTYLSAGDVSLAENTKFKSLPRSQRRELCKQLARVINEEDIGRHHNKWVRLFHNLHVGDYSKKVFKIAKKVRQGEKIASFSTDVEAALIAKDFALITRLLTQRPGEFGRRLDHVLRLASLQDWETQHAKQPLFSFKKTPPAVFTQQLAIVEAFLSVVDTIPTRNLSQLLGHLQTRHQDQESRVIFSKGSLQQAVIVEQLQWALDKEVLQPLITGIQASLVSRFAALPALGKTWLDPRLRTCPLPSQQRSASDALLTVARGTRLPLAGDKDTLRLFVYWQGRDIDLSATFHDADCNMIEQVSYTQLRSGKYQAYHSGDITFAPQGASEFIDINLPQAARHARYLAMDVQVFSGLTFAEHETCFVGWMLRDQPNSNEIYEPATVAQRLDLRAACRNVMPVVFDLETREMIWVDLPVSRRGHYINNVENNAASIQQKMRAIVQMNNKLSLYDLFALHLQARGEAVEDQAEAETVFSLEEGITPFHINTINAEFICD